MKNSMRTLVILLLAIGKISAQSDSDWEKDSDEKFSIQYFLGGTSCFSFGSYIDYLKSYHSAEEINSKITAGIHPLFYGTAGLQAMFYPIDNWTWDKLGFSIGIQYYQKGFVNKFNSEYTPSAEITDKTKYVETYRINTFAIPIQAYWGKRFFGTLGIAFESNYSGKKIQALSRSQSGSGTINGGYSDKSKSKTGLDKSVFDNRTKGFIVGCGAKLGNKNTLRLQGILSGKLLRFGDNFKTVIAQLTFNRTF